ncbi:MAG: hypothetical protein LIP28_09005, partial [Deltaproteobacteria bacterium]|nr:hypothetical protein [Deltaproteobacteria bacterium]
APVVARPVAETAGPAPVIEAVAATPDGPPEEGEEALDLNELDALLDDILATAPEVSSPSAAETTEAAPPAAESPSGKDSPDGDAAVVIPVPDQAIMPASEELSALMERVRRLEESVDVLESGEMSESMIEGFIDAKLHAWTESLFEPGSPVMDRICNEIRGRFAEGDLSESLEKMAAAAAAKVIREEIAGLMQEDG